MAVTRQARRARGSSPSSRLTRAQPVKAPLAHNRKSGLTRELAALGIIRRAPFGGPGYQGNSTRTTESGTECSICAEVQEPRQFPETASLSPCRHESTICRTCIARHTETQLSGDGKWRHVQCLSCHAKLSKAQIRRLVWREDFKRLEAFAKVKADEANPRYRSCLSTTCDSGQVHRAYKSHTVVCKACSSRSCFNHRVPWHEGYTCDRYDISHPEAKSTRTSEEMVKKVAKKCPGKGCGIYIEKDGGCDSMYCSRCQTSFDWGAVKHEEAEKPKDSIEV